METSVDNQKEKNGWGYLCPLLKQNYPYNPNGIHISMYVMLCVWGTLAWSQWFTNLHVGCLYVCACVCL